VNLTWPTANRPVNQATRRTFGATVDLVAVGRPRAQGILIMADLNELADEAAKELLKAIRDQAPKADDVKLLRLAQAYSLVVSAEVTAELFDEFEPDDDDEHGSGSSAPA